MFRFAESAPDPGSRVAGALLESRSRMAGHDLPGPPDGGTSLLVPSGPERSPTIMVSGPWLEPLAVPVAPGDRFWGVRLQPGAAREFLGIDPETLCNSTRPIDSLFGEAVAPLATAIHSCTTLAAAAAVMDASFTPRIISLRLPDPLAADVVAFVVVSRGQVGSAPSPETGCLCPHLLRRFRTATGTPPSSSAGHSLSLHAMGPSRRTPGSAPRRPRVDMPISPTHAGVG